MVVYRGRSGGAGCTDEDCPAIPRASATQSCCHAAAAFLTVAEGVGSSMRMEKQKMRVEPGGGSGPVHAHRTSLSLGCDEPIFCGVRRELCKKPHRQPSTRRGRWGRRERMPVFCCAILRAQAADAAAVDAVQALGCRLGSCSGQERLSRWHDTTRRARCAPEMMGSRRARPQISRRPAWYCCRSPARKSTAADSSSNPAANEPSLQRPRHSGQRSAPARALWG